MDRLSSTNQGDSENTGRPAPKLYAAAEKEDGCAEKRMHTARREVDENIVWDEV